MDIVVQVRSTEDMTGEVAALIDQMPFILYALLSLAVVIAVPHSQWNLLAVTAYGIALFCRPYFELVGWKCKSQSCMHERDLWIRGSWYRESA